MFINFRKVPTLIPVILLLACSNLSRQDQQSLKALVIMNSGSREYFKGNEYLIPYLDHFGVPYLVCDLAGQDSLPDVSQYPLVILSHPGIFRGESNSDSLLIADIMDGISRGTGLVSFDPGSGCIDSPCDTEAGKVISMVTFPHPDHYITQNNDPCDTIRFFSEMPVTGYKYPDAIVLAGTGDIPLLVIQERGKGRIACWTSMDWMHSNILGPLGGLDDCLWRSMVWAARKPFVMQGLPPMITMRVDDVAGRGELWKKSPLYWVSTSNKYGFKPWLGLFIYNLKPQAIEELRDYLLSGKATATPHAFGRPPRKSTGRESYLATNPLDTVPFYYNPESFSLRAGSYDEFIYFNHQQAVAWSDQEALAGCGQVV